MDPRSNSLKKHVNLDTCCLGNRIKQIRHDVHNVYGDQVRDGKRDKRGNDRQQLRANLLWISCDNVASVALVSFRSTWCLKTLAFRGTACRNLAHLSTDPGSAQCPYVYLQKYVQHSESGFKTLRNSFGSISRKNVPPNRLARAPELLKERSTTAALLPRVKPYLKSDADNRFFFCFHGNVRGRRLTCGWLSPRIVSSERFFPWQLEWKQIWRPESHLRPPGWEFWHPLHSLTFRERRRKKNTLWQKLEVPSILW